MEHAEYHPGWIKNVYPTQAFIRDSLANGELFIGLADGGIASAMAINQSSVEEYSNAVWHVDAAPHEVFVLHALGVSANLQGKGIGKRMVAHFISRCREKGAKALRLDVLGSNKPAMRLYESMGFEHIGIEKLYYEDTGLADFHLYELQVL
jgi:ribosomal protein S18 acetylase RimI-like enzyme